MSPIQNRIDEKRDGPISNYQHNLNLTLELQKLVDEHRMMEDYPMEEGFNIQEGDQEPLPFDMP